MSSSPYIGTVSEGSNEEICIDADEEDGFVYDLTTDVCMQGLESNLNDLIGIYCFVLVQLVM